MRKVAVALALCAALLAGACSANEATSNVGTLDAPAVKACREVRAVIQARAAGGIAAGDLRAQLAAAYDDAQASTNPILRARAVALFVYATEIARVVRATPSPPTWRRWTEPVRAAAAAGKSLVALQALSWSSYP